MQRMDAITVETLLAHAQFVRGLARDLVLDPATADDAVQQTWVEVCERPPHDLRSPRGWLATVTRQAVRKIRRSERRRTERELAAARPERVPSSAEIAEREETRRRLVDAVLALPDTYRDAIVLRFLEELAPREVAARLGVPVETARTRIRRGLELLRQALDNAWRGNRKAWTVLLAPWTLPSSAKASGTSIALLTTVLATSVTAVIAVMWAVSAPGGGTPPQGGSLAAAAGLDLGPGDPQTPDVALPPAAQGELGPRREAEPEPKPTTGGGGLTLTATLERATLSPRDTVVLSAEFANRGSEPLKLFVPEHVPLVPFPTWQLVADDGRTYAPACKLFQSMWTTGIQGTILNLAPGKTWATKVRADMFWRTDDAAKRDRTEHRDPERLPLGQYRVRCIYAKPSNEVPFGEPAFAQRAQAVPGLWTGEVAAPDLVLSVTASGVPGLAARLLGEPRAGDPLRVEIVARNPGQTELGLGDLVISLHAKGYGGCSAIVPADRIEGRDTKAGALTLLPGGARTVQVDLARLAFRVSRRGQVREYAFYELFPEGGASCEIGWSVNGMAEPLRADGLAIRTLPRAAAPIPGLSLTVLPAGDRSIQVRIENVGTAPLRVRKRLAWPIDLRVELTPTDAKRATVRSVTMTGGLREDDIGVPDPASVPDGLSWNGDRYERSGPLTAGDYGELPPGGLMTRVLHLDELVHGGMPRGEYRLRVRWTSRCDGRHLGLAPAAVGLLESTPLDLTVK